MRNRDVVKLLRADLERSGLSQERYAATLVYRGIRTLRRWLNQPTEFPVDERIARKLIEEENARTFARLSAPPLSRRTSGTTGGT